jgi:protein-S-isoprenylcysteine O-methyltransferase Ste14
MSLTERIINFVHRWAIGPARRRWVVSILIMFVFLSASIGVVWGAVILDNLIGLRLSRFATARQILGWPLVVFGAVLMNWTLIFFFREHGTPVPLNPPRNLITTGPYAVTRNPMLSGWFIAYCGIGLLLGSTILILVVTPLLILLFTSFVRRIEEPELTKRFGDQYVQYCKQVPRFFPKFRDPSRWRGWNAGE